jgi:hypothetical protein
VTASITRLWAEGRLPSEDAVFYADGRSFAVEVVDGRPTVIEEFDLDESLAEDPDRVSNVGIFGEAELAEGAGFLCCGDRDLGADGFFCRLDAARHLLWACFLTRQNPFTEITVEGRNSAIFGSTSGVKVTVDLDRPV